MDKKNFLLFTLISIYAALAVMAPIASTKISHFFSLRLPSGSILFAVALMILDVINNNWGKGTTRSVVGGTLIARSFVHLVMMSIVLSLPTVSAPKGFEKVVESGIRIVIAGELATLIAQWFIDIPLFHFLKERFKGRFFWFRYNASNFVSHSISSPVFVIIAFWGRPELNLGAVIASQLAFRYFGSVALTPVAVLLNRGVRWLTLRTK